MDRVERKDNLISDSNGSTLVTVIVAIAFVTILTAIILSTSLVNMQMKGIDRRAKDDFYYAEKALNDIYTRVGQQVQTIAAESYEEALVSVGRQVREGNAGSTVITDFKLSDDAQRYYKRQFVNKFTTWMNDNKDDFSGAIVDPSHKYEVTIGNIGASNVVSKELFDVSEGDSDALNIAAVRVNKVMVTAMDSEKSSQAIVSSDIVVAIPDMNFFGTNADVLDYGIIANDGIEIGVIDASTGVPTYSGDVKIEGNLYAGINNRAGYKEKSGININNGKTTLIGEIICSKGDINVGSGFATEPKAELDVHYKTDIKTDFWFDTIRTVKGSKEPKITINADTFALNDLELNADTSNVTISGNYYGYDDGTLRQKEDVHGNPLANTLYSSLIDKDKSHSDSSAVIINAQNASLTMRDISTFVLMGKAYIETENREIETAEGVAIKTNQQLYLLPTDFLSIPNPLGVTSVDPSTKYFTKDKISIPLNWFGTKYLVYDSEDTLEGGVTRINYKVDEVAIEDKKAIYAFLKFNDDNFYETLYDRSSSYNGETVDIPKGTVVDSSKSYKINGTVVRTYTDDELSAPFSARTGYIKEIMRGSTDGIKPTAAQLRKRASLSITNATHLEKCIILEDYEEPYRAEKKNVYSKNAVVSYLEVTPTPIPTPSLTPTATPTPVVTGEPLPTPTPEPEENLIDDRIKMISNTASYSRYAAYPQNLFLRYKWLCASLKNWDSIPMSGSIEKSPEEKITGFTWQEDSDFPFVKYVNLTVGTSKIDNTKNTTLSSVGKLYLNSDLTSIGGGVYRLDKPAVDNPNVYGFIICDGDLVVANGVKVRGMIIASGTVTFQGGNDIIADRALINRRIEDEIKNVRKTGFYRSDYLISYLIDDHGNLLYDISKAKETKLIDKTKLDYTDYVYYENWQKGGK